MATFDQTGRVVTHAVALQTLGLAIGPAVGGLLVEGSSFDRINTLGIALFAVSLGAILAPVLKQRSMPQRSD